MKRALFFPGQGSQQIGMGRELAAGFASARAVFDEVDDALNQKLSRLMFEGPPEELTLTENAQPAIMVTSMAALAVLEKEAGVVPAKFAHFFAGHSLGEYSALCAARSLSLADTARLLKIRGQAMQKAVPEGQGAMAAILGLPEGKMEEVIAAASTVGVVAVANDNSPEQQVVSGTKEAVQRATEEALKAGAKKAVMLQVSAPFHSPLMKPAALVMEEALARTAMNVPTLPIIANVTAAPVHDPKDIRALLVRQVYGMVRWRESVQYLAAQGVESALELGAGKVLSGLVKRIAPGIRMNAIGTPADIEAFTRVEA